MKYILPIAAFIIAACISIWYCSRLSDRIQDESFAYRSEVARSATEQIALSQAKLERMEDERIIIDQEYARRIDSLERIKTRVVTRYIKVRSDTTGFAKDSSRCCKAFFSLANAADSANDAQTAIIAEQDKKIKADSADFHHAAKIWQDSYKVTKDAVDFLQAENSKLERDKRKRFSVGPHVGYGFRGADIGVSVQYSLFRF